MNDLPPIPPEMPPQSPAIAVPKQRPLGDDLSERVPITNVIAAVDAMLRHPRRLMFQLQQPGAGKLVGLLLLISAICSLIYGVVVGTFSGGEQLWIAPVKISAGLMWSAMICLPSLYIFTCLSGSQARLLEICGLLAGLMMLMTILLIGFAPVAWIFSQSTESIACMGALHLIFWFIATIFGVRFIKAGFTHANAKSHAGLNVWVIIFLLVALQMTTALRPIIGTANTFFPKEKQFFLVHWGDSLNSSTGAVRVNSRE